MAPTGVEQQQGAAGIGGGQRRRVGRQQQMARQIGLLPEGVGQENEAGRAAQGAHGALAGVFAAADDDEDFRWHGGTEYPLFNVPRPTFKRQEFGDDVGRSRR